MLETVEFLEGCGELIELRENSLSFWDQQPRGEMYMYMKKYTYMTDGLYCGCLGEAVGGGWWVGGRG